MIPADRSAGALRIGRPVTARSHVGDVSERMNSSLSRSARSRS